VALVPMGAEAEKQVLAIAQMLRASGARAEFAFSGNMKKRMKHANKIDAWAAVILGEDELSRGVAQLKTLDDGEQREVPLDSLARALEEGA
jgi:histidyl-tRNA synthetase